MHSLRSGLQLEERPGRTGASINHHTEGNQMPRDKHDSKDLDNGDEEGGQNEGEPTHPPAPVSKEQRRYAEERKDEVDEPPALEQDADAQKGNEDEEQSAGELDEDREGTPHGACTAFPLRG